MTKKVTDFRNVHNPAYVFFKHVLKAELQNFKGCAQYIFLLVCFVCLKESTCETRKNIIYFTSKALFVLEIIKF